MNYAKAENGAIVEYPFTMAMLKTENPNTSFPRNTFASQNLRSGYGVVEVVAVSSPVSDTHTAIEVDPVLVNGQWTQTWDKTPKTVEQLTADVIARRVNEYGPVENQIEYITENGLEAWQAKVAEIKTRHPKP